MLRYFRKTLSMAYQWAFDVEWERKCRRALVTLFLTLREAIEKFGVDATRLSLADAGDGLEDADFEEKAANANIFRVHTLLGWCEVSQPFVISSVCCSNGILRKCSLWKRTCAMVLAITTMRFSFRKLMPSSISL